MTGPVLLAVDDDPDALRVVEGELRERYSRDYTVLCEGSCHAALETLERMRDEGQPVALVLSAQWLPRHDRRRAPRPGAPAAPHAKRGLLIEWGDWGDASTGDAIYEAMAHGRIDYYVLRPSAPPDELFHQTVSSLLLEWARLAADRAAHDLCRR